MNILNYYFKTCIVVTLIIVGNLAFCQTITSVASGDWDVPANWDTNSVPVANDVIIKHAIFLNTTKTINSLTITNDVAHAKLDINTNGDLTVTTNVSVIGTDVAFNTAFDVEDGVANINGDFSITDNNTKNSYVRLKMDNASTMDVSGNFTYTRDKASGSNSSVEIWMGITAGSTPALTVAGEFKVDYLASSSDSDNFNLARSPR